MTLFSPIFKKTLSNLTWLSFDRALRMIGAVVVNAWLTRYLGPEQNGILNYALAFVGMFTPLGVLGMDAIVIRDIVRDPSQKGKILGTAFGLRLSGASLAVLCIFSAIMLVRPHDVTIQVLVVLSSLSLFFQTFDVIDYWFQSQIQSKFTVYAKNAAFFTISVVKVVCILAQSDLMVFVILIPVEFALSAILLIAIYHRNGYSLRQWFFDRSVASSLLRNSWPIIISDVAVFAQTRIDQVLIGEFLSNSEVGYYAAAQKVSEPLNFIPMIIMSSIYPVFVRTKEWSEEEFKRRMVNLYRIMFIITVAVCSPISLFSEQIVHFLYGEKFAASGAILTWLIWIRFYANFGTARSIFISTENLFRHALLSSSIAIGVNIICNYVLIQMYGVYGAIIATNISFLFNIFIIDAMVGKTRGNFSAMLQGIFTFYRFSRTGSTDVQ